ncbi:hypothetical protein D8Y16_07430 [Listeria seeligeri]|nr:hypothetical protein [Listeria seeligeri]
MYKKWWFWLIVVIAVGAIGSALGGNDTAADDTKNTEKEESIPSEYKSALKKAEQYSSMMKMSKAGIYDQLTSEAGEKFSAEAGKYAIDNLKADYNANALAKAEDYQKTMAMAPEAIRDQLTSSAGEKFTAEEADYAIQNLSK